MIRQDIFGKQVKLIYLAIGSNLGDRFTNIELAKKMLAINNIFIKDTSSYYETPSWPNRSFPKFLNIVLKVKTDMSLINLFKSVKNIEKKVGRKKALKNHPRICDIDIIDFNGLSLKIDFNGQKIETPHPKMHTRNFVLLPLLEIEKNWKHPIKKKKIQDLIENLDNVSLYSIKQI